MRAEFEEKEYEIAAAVELGSGRGLPSPVLSPGQVLERLLGYDAGATPPSTHPVWRLLAVPFPPGVRLVPALWAPGTLPTLGNLPRTPLSLFFQYKRPEILRGSNAAQWSYWNRSYFRFRRSKDQQTVLARLERNLGDQAVVRYAAPAFHRRSELEDRVASGRVLAASGYVSPRDLGSHSVWTYVEPGLQGRANPSGSRLRFQTIEEIGSLLSIRLPNPADLPVVVSTLREHIAHVGSAAGAREPRTRTTVEGWIRALRREGVGFTEIELDVVRDFALASSVLSRIGAIWAVVA